VLKGIEVVAPMYEFVFEPKDGLIKVKKNGLFGFLNANTLKEATPCIYSYIYDKKDGKYRAILKGKEIFINEDGSL